MPGQKLHSSVVHGVQQENGSYEPKALLEKFQGSDIDLTSWSKLSAMKMENLPGYIERDLYDEALGIVHVISSAYNHMLKHNDILGLVKRFGAMVSSRA